MQKQFLRHGFRAGVGFATSLAPALMVLLPIAASAQLDGLELTPDITVSMGGEVLGPDEVGSDDLAGNVTFTGSGLLLAAGVHLDGFDRLPGGIDALVSTDIPADLGSGVIALPADVVRVSAGTPSLLWNSSAAGLAAGSDVDAIGRFPDGDLLLSFDTTVQVGGVVADDEDLVRIDMPAGTASLAFDGSAHSLGGGTDLDGVDVLADGRWLLSFDVSDSIGGVAFSDEDALIFNPATSGFLMAYDGSAHHAAWGPGDLSAIKGSLDPDGDGIADSADLCPFYAQVANLDADGDKRGNECECTDQNLDGQNSVLDLVAINLAIYNTGLVTPLCDGNNDSFCNVVDIVAANHEIFSPTNTSTCGRQPYPGP